jgi:hypothetical protein
MRIERDQRFDDQRRAFALRFTCEECAFFHEPSGACVHDFPNEEHRLSYYDAPGRWIVFCKDFDLR